MNLNKLYLIGTLKTDPETRETHSGSSVTRIVVVVHRDYFSKERNQRVRESDSFEVQAWGQLGQQIAQQFKKNAPIFIEGRLKQDTWETPTGERRQRTVVHAENFAPVGARIGAPIEAGAPAEGAVAAGADEGPTPSAGGPGGPGASGKRKRRRRRGPRRDGLPAEPVQPQTPEERAAFAAGLVEAPAGGAPPPPAEAPAPGTAPTRSESPAPPAPPSPPPPPAPPAEKPKPATSLKEDMPF